MAIAESTQARLRVAAPSKSPVMTNGTSDHDQAGNNSIPNGKVDSSNTNGALDFLRSSIKPDGHPSIEDLLMLLLQQQKSSSATGEKLDYDWVKDIIQRSLQKPDQSSNNNAVKPTSSGLQSDTAKTPMLVTHLGSAIINSSDEPIAAVTNPPALPSIHGVIGSDSPRNAAAEGSVIAVEATAPKYQGHASVWQSVIDAGRHAAPLTVNGQILREPALVTVDTNNQLVHLPLSLAVDSQSTSHPLANKVKPVVSSLFAKSISRATTPLTNTAVEVPHVLLKQNLASNESHTVPAGFVLSGTIKLFGGKIEAQRYTFHGAAAGDDEKAELAVISQSPIAMDDLTQASGFTFGNLMLQHPSIEVLSKPNAAGKNAGIWLNASLTLNGSLAETSSILKDIFAKDFPSLDVSVQLGGYQGLGDFIKPPSQVAVIADVAGLDVKLGGFVELTSAKVQMHGAKGASGYAWDVELDGTALLTVPGSAGPLAATYSITKAQSTYSLTLELVQKGWTDAMGVPGFHLNNAKISASFTKETQNSVFVFDIAASIALDTTAVDVTGHYSKDDWSFHGSVGDFTLQKLETAFASLFKAPLLHCDHDVTFTGLALDVTSQDKTLNFTGGVTIDSYTAASADLKLSPTGVHLVGNLAQATFDKVTLTKAQLDLVITKSGLVDPNPKTPGTTAAFTITGVIQINNAVTIDAEVAFAKASDTGLVWVVYAKAATNFSLSKFVSVPQDLDFQLENVVAMASNTDDGSLFPVHAFDYTVKKGFHLRATLDCPDHLAKMMHTPPTRLTLGLDLGSTQQEIEFIFSAEQTLTLKPGMVAPSVTAGIMLTANPQIFVAGHLAVQLSGQPGPLDFDLRMQAGATEAQASASLQTDWVNPFNISPKVKVLAPVTLGVIIDYAAVTYPSGLSFQGGLQVGETTLHAAFEVGQNPQDGVLLVQAQNLSLRDIVSFASLVIQHDLPLPASDLLYFKDLSLGISTGGTIGGTSYPPGATFNADATIFGKEVKVHCAIDKSLPGMQIAAEIDAFQLGPLVVSGPTGTNPKFDLEFGTKLQQLSINGKIALFDSDIATTVQVVMVPPQITFDAELKFSDLLTFKIDAHAAGDIKSIKDVVKADFSLYALLEQKLLDYMMALATTYMATAKKAADEGLDSVTAKLTQAQQQYDDKLASAQRDLAHAQAVWNQKSQDVNQAVESKKTQIKAEEAAKRAAVDAAEKAFNNKIDSLTRSLQQTKNDAAAKVQAASQQLNDTKRNVNNASKFSTPRK